MVPLQVTIFERESYLGGRIHSIHTYDGDGRDIVNLGAHTFDADDELFAGLARDASVELRYQYPNILGAPLSQVSIWDGEKVVFQELERAPLTQGVFKRLVWQNLMATRFWDQLALDAKTIWNKQWAHAKWVTIGHGGPDKELLTDFARTWGLSVEPQKVIGDVLGMCRCRRGDIGAFLERLVGIAEALVHFNSTVTRIVRHENQMFDVYWTTKCTNAPEQSYMEHFDAVVLAPAFGQTDIQIEPPLTSVPKKVEYTPFHVTHFISREPLDPTTFNLFPGDSVPDILWNVDNGSKVQDIPTSPPSFLTLTRTTRPYLSGCEIIDENVYKVTSGEFFSDDDIAILLNNAGIARETITFPDQACFPTLAGWPPGRSVVVGEDYFEIIDDDFPSISVDLDPDVPSSNRPVRRIPKDPDCSCEVPIVRWVHRQYWPNGLPVVDDTDSDVSQPQVELAPRLFYTAGFEGEGQASISKSVASALDVSNRMPSIWQK